MKELMEFDSEFGKFRKNQMDLVYLPKSVDHKVKF